MNMQTQVTDYPPLPKFYRQRFLLEFLQFFGGNLSKLDFQKLLFLTHQKTNLEFYDFVPYKFGCYSFHAQSDVELLQSTGWFEIDEKTIRLKSRYENITQSYKLNLLMRDFAETRGRELIKYVYKNHPYYAIYSKMAEDIMDKTSFQKMQEGKIKMQKNDTVLFTIGYEGVTFEKYVNKLIKNNIKLLCDVRKNPISRKFGFSKGIMSRLLPKLGIEYLHIGELGIPSEMRKKLETKEDYIRLFELYSKSLLNKKTNLERIATLIQEHNRIALTCFEKQADYCHRHCISNYLETQNAIKVTHL